MSYEVNTMLGKLPKYQGRKKLLKGRQYTSDIMQAIMTMHPKMATHYDSIAGPLWQGDVPRTAQYLYDFAKRNLPYQEEKTVMQTVKTPAAILEERYDFGNDCKHYASFIVGIADALRRKGHPIQAFYRFASYRKGVRSPGHVFAVFRHNGRDIWADPVPQIPGFDSRKISPAFHVDKMPPAMSSNGKIGSLYEISGVPVPNSEILAGLRDTTLGRCPNKGGDWLWSYQAAPVQQHMPQRGAPMGKAKKKHRLRIKIRVPKIQVGKFLAKAVGAPSRNAFLLLVKLNVFHLATKMWTKAAHDKNSSNWKRLADKWKQLGGKPDKLYKEIVRGVKTFNKLHKSKKAIAVSGLEDFMIGAGYESPEIINGVDDDDTKAPRPVDYIGSPYTEDTSISGVFIIVADNHQLRSRKIGVAQAAGAAAIIAAAGPILAALKNILSSFGVNTKKAADTADEATTDMAEKHNKAADEGQGNEDGSVTHPDGSTTKVETGPDGQTLKTTPSGMTDGAQAAADGDGDDGDTRTVTKTKTKTVTTTDDGDGGMLSTVKDYIAGHKMPLIATGAGVGLLLYSLSKPAKKLGAVQPILGVAGGAAIVWGGINLFRKQ
jgi:hypothetical protein